MLRAKTTKASFGNSGSARKVETAVKIVVTRLVVGLGAAEWAAIQMGQEAESVPSAW
jgi:hypothetical protein